MNAAPFLRFLLRGYWVGVACLIVYALLQLQHATLFHLLGGALIAFFALLPMYLWCVGKVGGMPIFPLFTLTYLATHAMPMFKAQKGLARYSDDLLVCATLTTSAFLAFATLIWWQVVRQPLSHPTAYLSFPQHGVNRFFFGSFFLGLGTQFLLVMGLLPEEATNLYTLLRSISLSLILLAVTVLSDRWGRKQLCLTEKVVFVLSFLVYFVITLPALILIGSIVLTLLAIATYTLARGRIPFMLLVITFAVFFVLNAGKWAMRKQLWAKGHVVRPSLQDYPAFYASWFGHGISVLTRPSDWEGHQTEKHQDLLERASVLQMLLLVQKKSSTEVPFLMGQTYIIIPELLIPRIFNKDKKRAHEGTYIMSIHYGLQTRKDVYKTTIGFGLLAESYANFGFLGVACFATLIGWGLGTTTRWSQNAPLTSFRGLFSLLCLAIAMQTESPASVVVTSLFQATVTLLLLTFFTMNVVQPGGAEPDQVMQSRLAIEGNS